MSITSEQIFHVNCGTANSFSQSLYSNVYNKFRYNIVQLPYYTFQYPQFTATAGVSPTDYLTENVNSLFTQVGVPALRFIFTGNSFSLSSTTDYFVFSLHKLDYGIFSQFSDNQPGLQTIQNGQNANSTIGSSPTTTRQSNSNKTAQLGNSVSTPYQRQSLFGQPLTPSDLSYIQSTIDNPIVSVQIPASAITPTFDFSNSQYVKQFVGQYASQLYTPKSQYFFEVSYIFTINLNKGSSGYSNYVQVISGITTTGNWNDSYQVNQSLNTPFTINQGPFAGLNVNGNYFCYMPPPSIPSYDKNVPLITGSTQSPTLNVMFGNGEGMDTYKIQVATDTTDLSFTGSTVVDYDIDADQIEENVNGRASTTTYWPKTTTISRNNFSTNINVQPNSNIIFRIGNGSTLVNLFGVKQTVYSFGCVYTAATGSQDCATVLVQNDSPYISGFTGLQNPTSTYTTPQAYYILSGNCTISGGTYNGPSAYSGQTIQLYYPNLASMSTITDNYGNFSFSGIGIGSPYQVYTNDPVDAAASSQTSLSSATYNINVTGNTIENLSLQMLNTLEGITRVNGDFNNGVTVTIVNQATNLSASTVSGTFDDMSFTYSFTGLYPGEYTVLSRKGIFSSSGSTMVSANTIFNTFAS